MATRIRILRGCPPSPARRLEVGGAPPAEAPIRSSPRGVSESLQVDQWVILPQGHRKYRVGVCPRKGLVARLFMEVGTERPSYLHNVRSPVQPYPRHQQERHLRGDKAISPTGRSLFRLPIVRAVALVDPSLFFDRPDCRWFLLPHLKVLFRPDQMKSRG